MEYTINVSGMTCGHCVARVKNALESGADIHVKEIDLNTGRVIISSNTPPDPGKLRELLSEAGAYSITA